MILYIRSVRTAVETSSDIVSFNRTSLQIKICAFIITYFCRSHCDYVGLYEICLVRALYKYEPCLSELGPTIKTTVFYENVFLITYNIFI